jgi:hypothetical protein
MALVCLALACAVPAGCGGPTIEPSPPPQVLRAKLRQPVSVSAEGEALRDVLARLAGQHEVAIAIDEAALETESLSVDGEVTLELRDLPLASALRVLLRGAGLTFDIDGSSLRVTTPSARAKLAVPRTHTIADLTRPPGFTETDVARLVRYLFSTHPQPTKDAPDDDGVTALPGMLAVKRPELVQDEIAEFLSGLRRAAGKPDAPAEPATSAAEAAVRRALETPLRARFKDTPLRDMARDLGQRLGINIVIDSHIFTQEQEYLLPLRTTYSLPDECPVSVLLHRILGPLQLEFVVWSDCLLITAPNVARDELIDTRLHRWDDIFQSHEGQARLAERDAILQAVTQQVSAIGDRQRREFAVPVPGALLIHAPAREQGQVGTLFARLRRALDARQVEYDPTAPVCLSAAREACEARLRAKLDEPVVVDFRNTRLANVASKLYEIHGMPVVIPSWRDQSVDFRCGAPVPLGTVLHLIAEPMELGVAWDHTRQAMMITAPGEAELMVETRAYRIPRLAEAGGDEGALGGVRRGLDDILGTLLPGPTGAWYVQVGDILLVSHNQAGHEQVAGFLEAWSAREGPLNRMMPRGEQLAILHKALATPVKADWKDQAVSVAIADLQAQVPPIHLELDLRALERDVPSHPPRVVSLSTKETPLRFVLAGLCEQADLRWLPRGGVIVVTSLDSSSPDMMPILFQRPASFAAAGLGSKELVQLLSRQVEEDSWRPAGGPGVLEFAGDRLLVSNYPKTTQRVCGVLESLCRGLDPESMPPAEPVMSERAALERALAKTVHVKCGRESLEDVLARLQREHELRIRYASAQGELARRMKHRPAPAGLNVAEVPLAEALDYVLAPDLSWTIRHNHVLVGPAEELNFRSPGTHVYDIRRVMEAIERIEPTRFWRDAATMWTSFLTEAVDPRIGSTSANQWPVTCVQNVCVVTLHARGQLAIGRLLSGAEELAAWSQQVPAEGAPDREKIAFFVRGLKHPAELVRAFSAFALAEFTVGQRGRVWSEAIFALADATTDARISVRRCALAGLPSDATDASLTEKVATALAGRLSDPDRDLRDKAVARLRELGKAAARHAAALAQFLRADDDEFRTAVAGALAAMGKPGLDELATALRESASAVRRTAVVALGKAGAEAEFAIPAIGEFIHQDDGLLFAHGCEALAQIGAASVPALKRLALGEGVTPRPIENLRSQALHCLILAAQRDATLMVLKELATDPAVEIREAAREAIKTLAFDRVPEVRERARKVLRAVDRE